MESLGTQLFFMAIYIYCLTSCCLVIIAPVLLPCPFVPHPKNSLHSQTLRHVLTYMLYKPYICQSAVVVPHLSTSDLLAYSTVYTHKELWGLRFSFHTLLHTALEIQGAFTSLKWKWSVSNETEKNQSPGIHLKLKLICWWGAVM